MEAAAKVTSKAGDRPIPDFLALAGTIRVPVGKCNVAWSEVLRRTRSERAAVRR
jgi:hypothetical protein